MDTKKGIIFITTTTLVFGIALGMFLGANKAITIKGKDTPTFVMSSGVATNTDNFDSATYSYINKTVTADIGKHFIINFGPMKNQLQSIQKKYPQKTYIYFNYLNNASWVGLNERDLFTAASVVKVPLAMAILKAVEEKKLKLSDSYTLTELDLKSNFGDLYNAGQDNAFTTKELITIMLEQSDDNATVALLGVLNKMGIQDPLSLVYSEMGWDIASGIGVTPTYQNINLKTLSNMFISLYNATYLTTEDSNLILSYLAHTSFSDKIVDGIPPNVPIVHKVGIADNKNTFSDCGIVYAPNRNYLLCLGLSDGDENTANKFMAEISKTAYDYVINN